MAKEDIGSLVVRIEANLKNFNNGVNDVSKKIDKLGGGLKRLGKIIGGAFAVKAVVGAIKDVTDATMAQERAENRLQTLASNVPGTTQAQIDALKKLAAAQQNVTTIGDEVTIAGQSQLATFQLSADSIGKLTPAFQDLAVATYGANVSQEQMIQSGNLIGKVMQGQVGALSRVGVSFTDAQAEILKTGTESEKTAALIEVLNSNFGGLAETTRNTTEGSIIAMKNAWGDMKEVLGSYLLPTLGNLATWFSSKIPQIQSTMEKAFTTIGNVIKFVGDNADIIIPIMTGLTAAITAQFIIGGLTKLYKAWSIATQAQTTLQWLLNIAMEANPFGLVAAAIGILVAAGIYLYKNWDKVKETALNVFGKIKSFVMPIIDSITNGFKGMVNGVVGALNFMIRALNKLKFTVPDWVPAIGGKGFGFNIPEIPKFAKGTNFVPFDTTAFIHKGEAVIPANNNPSNPNAKNPIGQTVNYEGMFNGATFNVRSDNDIKLIAREIFNLQQSRSRGNGVIAT